MENLNTKPNSEISDERIKTAIHLSMDKAAPQSKQAADMQKYAMITQKCGAYLGLKALKSFRKSFDLHLL